MKFTENAKIISTECIDTGIYSMWLQTDNIALNSKPGQFISVYSDDGSRLLPRPISICEAEETRLRIVYRVVGKGTKEFSEKNAGDTLRILGPLGNGYELKGKKAILFGGGIGIPPMLELAKRIDCEKSIVLGYRDSLFLNEEFEKYGRVYIATEDGSTGIKGNVLDCVVQENITGDVIYACGPMPMLRAIKQYAAENDIEAYISLEEKMACGVGACLACVCKTKEKDHHSNVNNARICADGPVFNAKEVEI